MLLKRKLIFTLSFLLLIFILFCALTYLYYYIPTFVESKIVPMLAKEVGIENFACDIRRIGFTGADLGSLRIGNDKNPALSVESVQIDYSPKGLYKRHIKRAVFYGIELRCELKNGEFVIPGLDLKRYFSQPRSERKTRLSLADTSQAISIGSFEIRNAVVICEWKGKKIRVPIELEIVPRKNWSFIDCALQLYPLGYRIVSKANIDLDRGEILIKFDAKAIHLERFADFVKLIPGLILSGEADIKGKANLKLEPFKISSASASCELRNTVISYNNLKLQGSQDTQKKDIPFCIEISWNDGEEWKFSGSSISLVSPIPLKVSSINCSLGITQDIIKSSGNFAFTLEQFDGTRTIPVKVLEPLRSKGNYFVKLAKNGKWEFRFSNTVLDRSASVPKNCKFRINHLDIISKVPKFNIFGKGKNAEGYAIYKVMVPDVYANAKNVVIKVPFVSLKGEASFCGSGKGGKGLVTFMLQAPDTDLTVHSADIKIPDISLTGGLMGHKGGTLRFDGALKFADAKIVDSKLKTTVQGVSGMIPLKWPCEAPGTKGKVSVKTMQWKNWNIGSFTGSVQQEKSGVVFEGEHINNLLPGLKLNLIGRSVISSKGAEAEVNFHSHYRPASDIDLGQFLPAAKGVMMNGELEFNGDWTFDNTGMRSSLNGKLNNAEMLLKDKGIAVEGINVAVSVPDLFGMRSAPGQQLSFERASFGELNVDDGKIEFQIESARSFFIEKSSFRWCDGYVYTQAFRISPGVNDYDLILYCDRLKLAMILDQFGAVNAEGEGTVSGRIPLRFKDNKLSFNDGFLFSSPGEGGTIHLIGTEMLMAGIPPNTPQYAQIELAREVLKDYDYKWVKLRLITEGEDLLLRLQFDGKPAKPLPFVYKKQLGRFIKIKPGGKGSIFQGISLDVNFRLPLDRILQYKDLINIIQQNKE